MPKDKDRSKETPDTKGPDLPDTPDVLDELRRLAASQGLAVQEDTDVEELLKALDPMRDMPEAPYQAVSKILERVRACEEKLSGAGHPAPDQPD
ncbi:MAG: hypothetical protein SVS15_06990, partial [Thermodesulfobacteriota bacterium]|nr:hypothetical protein [Thermodesulfobacteriota bacterium]